MTLPLAASKRRKPIVTYGRSSRPRLPSFKVFQDIVGEEKGFEKTKKDSGIFYLFCA